MDDINFIKKGLIMPNCTNRGIILNRKETVNFLQNIAHPNPDTIKRRDNFLADIERTLTITETDGGVMIEFSTNS